MADLHERISQLETELASLKAEVRDTSARETPEAAPTQHAAPASRRQLLKLAGAAAVGAAGASLLSATPASATTGAMMFGATNNAGTDFTELDSSASVTFVVTNSGSGAGVFPALVGVSTSGYGLAGVGGLAPLRLGPATTTGPPTTGGHLTGEVFVDVNVRCSSVSGSEHQGTWVRVGFNPLTPMRILDTRNGTGGITGPLTAGQTVDLTVGGMNGVPTQASAVVMNATVAEPSAASFLTIWPHGVTRPLASNLNWTPGQIVANLVTVKLGTGGVISIFNNVGDVQVILDLAGFYS